MAYVLYRDDKVIVALDDRDEAPYLIVTLFDEDDQIGKLLAEVRLPPNGVEVISYSEGRRAEPEPAPSVEWGNAAGISAGPHPAWRRPA